MSDAEQRAAQLSASPYHGNDQGGGGHGTGRRKGKRRGKGRRTHAVAKVLLASVVVLGMVTGLGVTFLYRHFDGNINYQDLSQQLPEEDRPDEVDVAGPQDPMNILVMGDDSRDCAGCGIDAESGGGSDTTILIHPHALLDFEDYNDFLDIADEAVEHLGLEGVIQVASFHPDYRFEGSSADDITNYSNRSPVPLLHLLRESSIERAVAAFPDAAAIFERNIETLRRLGPDGWRVLMTDSAS